MIYRVPVLEPYSGHLHLSAVDYKNFINFGEVTFIEELEPTCVFDYSREIAIEYSLKKVVFTRVGIKGQNLAKVMEGNPNNIRNFTMGIHKSYMEPFQEKEEVDWKKKYEELAKRVIETNKTITGEDKIDPTEVEILQRRLDNIGSMTPYDVTEILSVMRISGHNIWADALEDVSRANYARDNLIKYGRLAGRNPTENLDLAIEMDRKRINAERELEDLKKKAIENIKLLNGILLK